MEFYGGYEVYSESGIDLTLLRERLKMTVTERLQANARALKLVEAMRRRDFPSGSMRQRSLLGSISP